MKNKKKLLSIIAVLLVAIISSVGYLFMRPQEDLVVGLKWLHQAQFTGMYVAQEENIYKKNGLNVTFKEFKTGTNQVDQLVNGTTDIEIMSAEEFVLFASEGAPITAVAAIYQASPFAVASLTETNINSPADLQGKRMGIKGGKIEQKLFAMLLLYSVGLNENSVTFTDLGFDTSEVEDLANRTVDTVGLYRTNQRYLLEQSGIEYNIIYPEQFGINIFNDIIVARTETVENNPDLVSRFIKATIQGWDMTVQNPEDALNDTFKYITFDDYKNRDHQMFVLTESIKLIKPSPNTAIGSMSVSQWRNLYNNMYERGNIQQEFDISQHVTTEFIQ